MPHIRVVDFSSVFISHGGEKCYFFEASTEKRIHIFPVRRRWCGTPRVYVWRNVGSNVSATFFFLTRKTGRRQSVLSQRNSVLNTTGRHLSAFIYTLKRETIVFTHLFWEVQVKKAFFFYSWNELLELTGGAKIFISPFKDVVFSQGEHSCEI